MSVQAMSWAMAQKQVNDSPSRHVLLCLANYAGADGRGAFPSAATLSADTGLSERTVRSRLDSLEQQGLIRRGNQAIAAAYIDRADRRPVCYDLSMERGATDAPRSKPGATDAPREGERGASDDGNGVHPTTERGAGDAPNTSLNHQEKKANKDGAERDSKLGGAKPKRSDDPPPLTIDDIVAEGVDRQHAADWFIVRKAKKAPLTQTAWDGVKAEAVKAGITPAKAVHISAENNWQGFKAAWYQNVQNNKQGNHHGTSNSGRRESEAERVERINREHDEREHASGMF